MKRTMFLALFLTAVVLLIAAVVFVACENVGGTGVTVTPLSESATSNPVFSSIPGETTTTASLSATTTVTSSRPPAVAATTTIRTVTMATSILTTNLYEEDDPRLAWSGTWSVTGSPEDSGGSCRFAEYAGSSMKVYFSGVSISFITRIGPAVGIATISLDGGSPVTIDLYSPTWGYQKEVWSAGSLAPGSHTLKIECPGDSNPASGSKGIYVDAFAVTGTLE